MLLTFHLDIQPSLEGRERRFGSFSAATAQEATPQLAILHRRQMTISLLPELLKITNARRDILTWKSDFTSYQF